MRRMWLALVLFVNLYVKVLCSERNNIVPPPLPLLPLPTATQLKWQERELIMFHHFGMNTFTDSEWGTGSESPRLFNPVRFDAGQWAQVAKEAGVSLVILTAKHHDGFCLWPSKFTNHSVVRSPWKGGKGDVVKEFVEAARARGLDHGLYLSPWDRHEPTYGLELEYNQFYMGQLDELLNGKYGFVSEVWFDGAKGNNSKNMTYHFDEWFGEAKDMQSNINIFSDAGPDIRWVGGETGTAGITSWSPINRTSLKIGDSSIIRYLNTGDPKGQDWVPPECDVSIREGWFWHKNEKPKTLNELLDIYYMSVGRNCVMLLNVPPNSTGLISQEDASRLKEFRSALTTIFFGDLARIAIVHSSSERGGGGFGASNVLNNNSDSFWSPTDSDPRPWLELRFINGPVKFNVVRVQEPIRWGQRVGRHEIYVQEHDRSLCMDVKGRPKHCGLVMAANGTTIGYKRLHRLDRVVQASVVRIMVTEARAVPLISSIGLHLDPYWAGRK